LSGFSFTEPFYLFALAALPLLWWLLRLTPPQPRAAVFPPLPILKQLSGTETAAQKSPWWLTLLRLSLAALLIFAFANPVRNAALPPLEENSVLALIIDNTWAAYPIRDRQKAAAQNFIAAAERENSPVYLIFTATPPNAEIAPLTGDDASAKIRNMSYLALPADRAAAFARLRIVVAENKNRKLTVAYPADGMKNSADKTALKELAAAQPASIFWIMPENLPFIGIKQAENAASGLDFTLIRAADNAPQSGRIAAYDEKGQMLGEQNFNFASGKTEAKGSFALPPAVRNDIAYLHLENAGQSEALYDTANAAAIRLMNGADKQKTVAVLAQNQSQIAQPLLSPLYYVTAALTGAPDIAGGKPILASNGAMEQNINQLLAAKPSLLIMGDTANIPPAAKVKLRCWVEQGGTLLRFAGPALANADDSAAKNSADDFWENESDGGIDDADDMLAQAAKKKEAGTKTPALNGQNAADTLLPVPLRHGERSFGGALSWEKPQKLAPFPQNSPFYGMAVPQDVTVSKQILAEPSADLSSKIWITLTDGTPLMTAAPLGKGRLVFLHTEPESSWSNLALSGFFVTMLRELVKISADPANNAAGGKNNAPLSPYASRDIAPYRIINAEGELESAPDFVRALHINGKIPPQVTYYNLPGFYGARNALYPINLLNAQSRFVKMAAPDLPNLTAQNYAEAKGGNLRQILLLLAAVLFIIDMAVSLFLRGGFRKTFSLASLRPLSSKYFLPAVIISIAAGLAVFNPPPAQAAQQQADNSSSMPNGESAADLAGRTHLAYVLTGNADLDSVSKAALQNLSRFIEERTTIEPGDAVGIDPVKDELAFYPLIYWPIDANAPMPSQKALSAIDAYMHHGGTVLFDTRDALSSGLQLGASATPNTLRLRAILAGMDVPPLTAAPKDHVIARSFYIMPDFPGRYRNSPLWIAASSAGDSSNGNTIRSGDGVSPILITANDFAGAWADDGKGGFLFPLIPDGEQQRLWAFRGGLNIVMYILTGNYKADQARAPELLRRFGN